MDLIHVSDEKRALYDEEDDIPDFTEIISKTQSLKMEPSAYYSQEAYNAYVVTKVTKK